MNEMVPVEIIKLVKDYDNLLKSKTVKTQRIVYDKIKRKIRTFFDKGGLNIISLIGLRGTGKSTILTTVAKDYDSFYVSGDFLATHNISLEMLIKTYELNKQKIIIIDEITYLKNWQTNLKVYGDLYKDVLFIISSSSALNQKELSADLSRRMDLYKIDPLHFSEFLFIKYNLNINIQNELKDAIFNTKNMKERYDKILNLSLKLPLNLEKYYEEFKYKQFPFLLNEENMLSKTKDIIDKVIYKDIPQYDNIYSSNLIKIESILRFLQSMKRQIIDNISNNVELKRDLVEKIFGLLLSSQLIFYARDVVPTKDFKITKKILFNVPALRFSLDQIHISSIIGFGREDMFAYIVRKLDLELAYNYKQNGYDYLVAKQKFEVGGKSKKVSNAIIITEYGKLKYSENSFYLPIEIFSLII
jgi:predicted AAA+ superfamily ATPase